MHESKETSHIDTVLTDKEARPEVKFFRSERDDRLFLDRRKIEGDYTKRAGVDLYYEAGELIEVRQDDFR